MADRNPWDQFTRVDAYDARRFARTQMADAGLKQDTRALTEEVSALADELEDTARKRKAASEVTEIEKTTPGRPPDPPQKLEDMPFMRPLIGMSAVGYGMGTSGEKMVQGLAESAERLATKGYTPGQGDTQAVDDAFNVAGTLATGGFASPKPANSLGTFGGRKAETANIPMLVRAQKMEKAGMNRQDVWDETGWVKGSDNKWRFEIPDEGLDLKMGPRGGDRPGRLSHPALHEAYPDSKHITAYVREGPSLRGWWLDGFQAMMAEGPTPQARKSAGAHELQHFLQDTEGFAKGAEGKSIKIDNGFWKQPLKDEPPEWTAQWAEKRRALDEMANDIGTKEKRHAFLRARGQFADEVMAAIKEFNQKSFREYWNAPGEIEARNVQKRLEMTPEDRKKWAPWVTADDPSIYAPGGDLPPKRSAAKDKNWFFDGKVFNSLEELEAYAKATKSSGKAARDL